MSEENKVIAANEPGAPRAATIDNFITGTWPPGGFQYEA